MIFLLRIYVKLLIIEFTVCVLIILLLTVYKMFDGSTFTIINDYYNEFARFDADVSLVLEGK